MSPIRAKQSADRASSVDRPLRVDFLQGPVHICGQDPAALAVTATQSARRHHHGERLGARSLKRRGVEPASLGREGSRERVTPRGNAGRISVAPRTLRHSFGPAIGRHRSVCASKVVRMMHPALAVDVRGHRLVASLPRRTRILDGRLTSSGSSATLSRRGAWSFAPNTGCGMCPLRGGSALEPSQMPRPVVPLHRQQGAIRSPSTAVERLLLPTETGRSIESPVRCCAPVPRKLLVSITGRPG